MSKSESTSILPILDDDQFPYLAALAGRNPYRRSLEAGQKVLIAEAGVLYEVSLKGDRRVVKHLQPRVPVHAGRILKLW